MMLVGGILGLIAMLSYLAATFCFILVWPGFYFEFVISILLIIRGINMLNKDDQGPPRTLAVLQIICIVNLDVINCVLGIIALTYGGFTYTKTTHDAKIGPLELSVKDKETVNVPVWAGIAAIVVGGALLVSRRTA